MLLIRMYKKLVLTYIVFGFFDTRVLYSDYENTKWTKREGIPRGNFVWAANARV